jgi:hypothetical protein
MISWVFFGENDYFDFNGILRIEKKFQHFHVKMALMTVKSELKFKKNLLKFKVIFVHSSLSSYVCITLYMP